MKVLIVGNPIASGGDARRRIGVLSAQLEARGHTVRSCITRFAGDAKHCLSGLKHPYDRIVIVGGDGTFNEALNGLPEKFYCPLLHLPTGNANLLAKDLDLPPTPEGAVRLIERGRVTMADVAAMNGKKFIMVAGAGFDARVTEEMGKVRRGKVSNLSYLLPMWRAMKTASSARLLVETDGNQRAAGAAVLICNVRTYAGICEIAWKAGVDTGCLDIVVLPGEGLWPLITYLAAARFSRITRLKGVVYLKARKVRISSPVPIPIQVDGDFTGRHPEVRIDLAPNSLPLVVP